ncbi:hypothetical protein K438DRAFT_2068084 [Mycena galopus ATCC 62051]|nr:hypothetical protein K438DRAFT_2068084 [Mycena galopus ATCC 62051]
MKYSATLVALSLVAFRAEAHRLPSRYAGQRRGDQFVTDPCTTDSDCQQGCCPFTTGWPRATAMVAAASETPHRTATSPPRSASSRSVSRAR